MTDLPPPPPSAPSGSYGAPPPPPSLVGKVKIRGRIPLRLALIFGVAGVALCALGIVLIVRSPITKTDEFARVQVNAGQQNVQLARTGETVIYLETPTGSRDLATVLVDLRDPSGTPVALRRYGNTLTFDINGRHAEALFTFDARATGAYRVEARSAGAPAGAQLSFGESVVHGIVAGVLCFVPGLLLVIAAVVLLIVGLVKRSRHKRELSSAYVGGGGPNYYTGR